VVNRMLPEGAEARRWRMERGGGPTPELVRIEGLQAAEETEEETASRER